VYRNNPTSLPPLHNLHFTPRVEQSQAINAIHSGAIIIAGSGMCNGGRILHHLKHNIHRSECHILFTGYQAEGTLGRAIVDGARDVTLQAQYLWRLMCIPLEDFPPMATERTCFDGQAGLKGVLSFSWCMATLRQNDRSVTFFRSVSG